MQLEFADKRLARLEADLRYDAGLSAPVARSFRKVVNLIRNVLDERELYQFKSLRFEKLKGNRAHQRSLRLNDQFRLIVEVVESRPKNVLRIVSVEDYH